MYITANIVNNISIVLTETLLVYFHFAHTHAHPHARTHGHTHTHTHTHMQTHTHTHTHTHFIRWLVHFSLSWASSPSVTPLTLSLRAA